MNTAKLNGYEEKTMKRLFQKHKSKNDLQFITTLGQQNERVKSLRLPFYPNTTHKLRYDLKKFNFKVCFNNNGKLSDLLGSMKDKIGDDLEKSGIYTIKCSRCSKCYIGQTKRKINIRFKEHCDDCRKEKSVEKPMPAHVINSGHPFGEVKLLKHVTKKYQLSRCV